MRRNIGVARQDILEATRRDLKATLREFKSELAALQTRTARVGGMIGGTSADRVKPSKFDGSTSWAVFRLQFEAAVDHKWTSCEKEANLLAVLQR